MILSGRELRWYIDQGLLKITPVQDNQFQQNGIDLILEELVDEYGNKPQHFRKGEFYLGRTREYFELPNDLMAFVNIRSSWARNGLTLPPTIVDAGFKGTLTLEIVANKHQVIKVPYGERVHHLIFAKTTSPCVPYAGKYQGQIEITNFKEDK